MVSEKMVAWGSQGCVIRDLAAYGEQRAAVVGAENVFNFTIGNPSVPAPSCVRQTIEHLLQTVPAEQLHAYTAAPGLASVRAKMAAYLEKTFGVGYRAAGRVHDLRRILGAGDAGLCAALAGRRGADAQPGSRQYKLYAEAAGGTLTAVPSNPEDFQIDLDAFSAAISEKTAVVLLNSPNNPSGAHPLAAGASRSWRSCWRKSRPNTATRIYILADEPYRELAYDGDAVPYIPGHLSRTPSTATRSASPSRCPASASAISPCRPELHRPRRASARPSPARAGCSAYVSASTVLFQRVCAANASARRRIAARVQAEPRSHL